jgi:hypothetical protein
MNSKAETVAPCRPAPPLRIGRGEGRGEAASCFPPLRIGRGEGRGEVASCFPPLRIGWGEGRGEVWTARSALPAILLLILGSSVTLGQTITVAWSPATNGVPDGYLLFHANAGALPDLYSAGNATNYSLSVSQLVPGANYFAVCAFQETSAGLLMSAYSNVATVTNTPALVLNTVIFSSTNLNTWLPWHTNHLVIIPGCAGQFFTTGNASLTPTNLITP